MMPIGSREAAFETWIPSGAGPKSAASRGAILLNQNISRTPMAQVMVAEVISAPTEECCGGCSAKMSHM